MKRRVFQCLFLFVISVLIVLTCAVLTNENLGTYTSKERLASSVMKLSFGKEPTSRPIKIKKRKISKKRPQLFSDKVLLIQTIRYKKALDSKKKKVEEFQRKVLRLEKLLKEIQKSPRRRRKFKKMLRKYRWAQKRLKKSKKKN